MTAILWENLEGGADLCVLERAETGWRLRGTALLARGAGEPAEVRYSVDTDERWATANAEVLVAFASGELREPVELGALWSGTDRPPGLEGCVDVDLGFTPATNTLPIRRLGLRVGESAEVAVAWLRWPELVVERAEQRYERLASDRYRFTQGDFTAKLAVAECGLVLEYEGLWRALARG